jgi:hypothetical protein
VSTTYVVSPTPLGHSVVRQLKKPRCPPTGIVARTLDPLLDYDAHHGTELLAVLATYLHCRGDKSEAARKAICHGLRSMSGSTPSHGSWTRPDSEVKTELSGDGAAERGV